MFAGPAAMTAGFVVVSLLLMFGADALTGEAHGAGGTQLEPATSDPERVRVTYIEQVGPRRGYVVELNTGAVWRLPRCRVEDGRNCLWDAGRFGNGIGRSFVDIRGELVRVGPRMMARAYREVTP